MLKRMVILIFKLFFLLVTNFCQFQKRVGGGGGGGFLIVFFKKKKKFLKFKNFLYFYKFKKILKFI